MTVAIAAKCISGTVLIADKEIALTDGSKTVGTKIHSRDFAFGTVTLASSTDDGLAAESLASEIFDRLNGLNMAAIEDVVNVVREQMQGWHAAYAAGTAPGLSYLLIVSAFGGQELYVVEPPRTVVSKHAYALGSGARVAQPLLDRLMENMQFQHRTSMMFLAYMAKRAAKETAMIGEGFDGLFIPTVGAVKWAAPMDMLFAEEMVFTVDSCIDGVLTFLMSLTDEEDREKASSLVRQDVLFVATQLAKQEPFASLDSTQ